MDQEKADVNQPLKLSTLAIRAVRQQIEANQGDVLLRDNSFIQMMKYFLQCKGNEEMQLEACCVFTSITASETMDTQLLLTNNIIPLLIPLLESPNIPLSRQALWTIGNVLGESAQMRDEMLKIDVLKSLLNIFKLESAPVHLFFILSWALVHIVRHPDEQVSMEIIRQLIPAFRKLLNASHHIKTRNNAICGLSFIAASGHDYIETIIESEIVPYVITLMPDPQLQDTAIQMLSSITAGTQNQASYLVYNYFLGYIRGSLFSSADETRRIALWCVFNISKCAEDHTEAIVRTELIPGVLFGLQDWDLRTVKISAEILCQVINCCELDLMPEVIREIPYSTLFELSTHENQEIAQMVRDAIEVLFDKSRKIIRSYAI